jgi:hypothetical protein
MSESGFIGLKDEQDECEDD